MGAESTTTESRSGRGSWSSEIGRDVVVEFAALCAEEEGECAFDVDASVAWEDAVVVVVALAGGTADVVVREGRSRAKARSIADFGDAKDDDDGCRRQRRGAVSLVATTRACWRPAASGIETRISIGFGELSLLSSR